MAQFNVLFVLTSHDRLGDTGKPTGWYLPEFAHPYYVLEPHARITVASPAGGEAPLDPNSVEAFKEDFLSQEFLKNKKDLWQNTEKLSTLLGRANEFDAIFIVGGHGPMYDLSTDPTLLQIIKKIYEADKVVSAVCHGPAALVNVILSDGSYLLEDSPNTGFSNAEEEQVGFAKVVPFSLEDELNKRSGGKYEKAADPWIPKVVDARGGRLLTGQNPFSAAPLASAVLAALKK